MFVKLLILAQLIALMVEVRASAAGRRDTVMLAFGVILGIWVAGILNIIVGG